MAIYRNGLVTQLWYGLYNPTGTNNTAELTTLHQALVFAEQEIATGACVQILSDSKYAIAVSQRGLAVGRREDGEGAAATSRTSISSRPPTRSTPAFSHSSR
jgi:ribonuclease HI